ncbi:acriflavin resistance protein [Gemmatirosa kalamazoonensis]|uniref:Acriflavin resistance protein n=1 Tax=Gemmatirosa kalamazoonensis TaxID=861299 RepID=W0RMV8_9BACT|nr:efflux RND transporter permease subunit [Gemmatirosa kalamazoonensis]AHG91807.1 acriflavin resistance protein [Gemmatirosa kalamazoonensis]
MWIVRLALRRPYTFIVGALLVVIFGVLSVFRTPTDVFPPIDIPVVSLIWQYSGLPAEEMERRITTTSERVTMTTVNDVEHIESQSLNGVAVVKIFFQPGAKIEAAVAQVSAASALITRNMPPGISQPFIIRYNASDVPVLQTAISSPQLAEQELYDIATNQIRTRLATVQGATIPAPYGGRTRAISVDLDPQALYARGISPSEVSSAINAQNVVLPGGSAKIGDREYAVRLNGSPEVVKALNDIPIKIVNGAPVYLRDVAQVRDGYAVQTNIVRHDGVRGTFVSALKSGQGSTIDVVRRIRATVDGMKAQLPPSLKIEYLSDQSVFVKATLSSVVKEAIIAACLTAAMILLFLGSWRSTLIVALSIPLSILTSLTVLGAIGQTINVMTLGGLALAVGVLVDDATVGIENIHRNLELGKDIEDAILDGAQQIAVPTFVSTLSICIVFVPVFFLAGAAKSLFAPLAMAVIFAMLASYVISRTLVPTLVKYALLREAKIPHGEGPFDRVHHAFERRFERLRDGYGALLAGALARPRSVVVGFTAFAIASVALVPLLGRDFFPQVDAGQIRVHLRTPAGTRLEQTERVTAAVERVIRETIPAEAVEGILDNIGITSGSYSNLAASDNPTIGVGDGEIQIALTEERDRPTQEYVAALRERLNREFPDVTFFFQAADIVGQILNFGLPAPIDVQVAGSKKMENYEVAKKLAERIKRVSGAVDVHVHQVASQPELFVSVDRVRAGQLGLTEREVASNLLVSLSGTAQTAPNFWLNPGNGVQYAISVMTPQYRIASMQDVTNTPLVAGGTSQLASNLVTVERRSAFSVVNHYNVQPVFDVYANVQGRDLGGVARDVDRVVSELTPSLPKGSSIVVRGQVASMRESFAGLQLGLVFAVVLVYLLMVVNFQSWTDPLIIILALPGALAGIAWMLYVTQTTLSVPSLMGAIMSVGVATANSILIVSFANEQRREGFDSVAAALSAGTTRLRPVLMTAGAMIIGMLPMALGLGEGGEQNAPLGRAVIGGLALATVATLFFVPVVYAALRRDTVAEAAPAPLAEVVA